MTFSPLPGPAFLAALALGLAFCGIGPALAQSGRVLAYGSQPACAAAGIVTAEECRQAFRNASAELDEKGPRFAKRAECESLFRRCMVGLAGAGPRDVYFTPQMREARIEIAGQAHSVRPVLHADHPAVVLDARPSLRPAEDVSRARRAEAQARWARRDEAAARREPSAGPSEDEPAVSRPGEVTSWPVPAHLRPKLIDNP